METPPPEPDDFRLLHAPEAWAALGMNRPTFQNLVPELHRLTLPAHNNRPFRLFSEPYITGLAGVLPAPADRGRGKNSRLAPAVRGFAVTDEAQDAITLAETGLEVRLDSALEASSFPGHLNAARIAEVLTVAPATVTNWSERGVLPTETRSGMVYADKAAIHGLYRWQRPESYLIHFLQPRKDT
jgi:hypothetical protein